MTDNLPALLPCPFCGGAPKTLERPDNIDGTEFVYAVSCYCDGYSARAHQLARCKTPGQAKAAATSAWNRRAAIAQAQSLPDGWVAVPKQITRAMRDATDADGWTWEDLLAAAEAITEAEYEALAASPAQPVHDEIAYKDAASLATVLFKKHFAHEEHYASGRVVWGPCDTTAGVISQIDNMVCGLIQPQPVQPSETQWQKRHPLRTEGNWENTNEHDAKWWRDNSQGWEIRVLYALPPAPQPKD